MVKHNKLYIWIYLVLTALIVLAAGSRQALSAEQSGSGTSKTKKVLASITVEEPLTVIIHIHGVTFEFVRIPAGRFQMGSETGDSDEKPVHSVHINESFYMGRTEVTVRQFRAFTEAAGYLTDAERHNWAWLCPELDYVGPGHNLNWRQPGFYQSEDEPAVCISYNDAVAFCRWLARETDMHIRLPSEAEWEYACRAGSTGDYAGSLGKMAWYDENCEGKTHCVAQKKPNAWGLYDMHGNAWEWCEDAWHWNYRGAPDDGSTQLTPDTPAEVASRRVMRGGAWCRPARELRSSYRYRGLKTFRNTGSGFRLVRSIGTKEEPGTKKPSTIHTTGKTVSPPINAVGPDAANQESLTFTVKGVTFDFVRIPAGQFLMGSEEDDPEKPVHQVHIVESFYMGKTEVTVRQFETFVQATDYMTDPEKEGWAWSRSGPIDWNPALDICWRNLGFSQSPDEPASCISWYDAIAFCRWLSQQSGRQISLPSEAQWEYACRAGTTGDYSGNLNEMAWHRYNSGIRTHPVTQKKPNAWGLYDMHGNVWEWCLDMWHKNYEGAPTDGSPWFTADTFTPVMRGGSFTNPPWWLRSANHMRNDPGCRFSYNHGFRIICSR